MSKAQFRRKREVDRLVERLAAETRERIVTRARKIGVRRRVDHQLLLERVTGKLSMAWINGRPERCPLAVAVTQATRRKRVRAKRKRDFTQFGPLPTQVRKIRKATNGVR